MKSLVLVGIASAIACCSAAAGVWEDLKKGEDDVRKFPRRAWETTEEYLRRVKPLFNPGDQIFRPGDIPQILPDRFDLAIPDLSIYSDSDTPVQLGTPIQFDWGSILTTPRDVQLPAEKAAEDEKDKGKEKKKNIIERLLDWLGDAEPDPGDSSNSGGSGAPQRGPAMAGQSPDRLETMSRDLKERIRKLKGQIKALEEARDKKDRNRVGAQKIVANFRHDYPDHMQSASEEAIKGSRKNLWGRFKAGQASAEEMAKAQDALNRFIDAEDDLRARKFDTTNEDQQLVSLKNQMQEAERRLQSIENQQRNPPPSMPTP